MTIDTICGADCNGCALKETCGGCRQTDGRPFGGECVVAACCRGKGKERCGECERPCATEARLIAEFNALGIRDMAKVTGLNALKGSLINLEYSFPGGQTAKLLADDRIYLGSRIVKNDGTGFYGLAADENFLLVCSYGNDGANAEIVLYKKRER